MMTIQTFPSGPIETNAYVISCPKTGEAGIVDPAPNSASAIVNYVKEHRLKPTLIFLTHSHWDHIGDVAQLKEIFQIPVWIHALDAPNLQQPGTDGLPTWLPIEGVVPDQCIDDGSLVKIGSIQFEVIHTPGHTPGGVCFYSKEEGVLLSGDTLFKGSMGNVSFPSANPEHMSHSLAKLAKLPPETTVYPGHGLQTTIGEEDWLSRVEEIFW